MEKRGGTRRGCAGDDAQAEDPLYADFARTFYLRKYNEYYPEKLTRAQLLALMMREGHSAEMKTAAAAGCFAPVRPGQIPG
ncbi:MAG: hypothetical protein ACLUVV_00520 [Christensenellales bacterium]